MRPIRHYIYLALTVALWLGTTGCNNLVDLAGVGDPPDGGGPDDRDAQHVADVDAAKGDGGECTTLWYPDADGDGYGAASPAAGPIAACEQPDLYVADHRDCDDADAQVHPGATEYCGGVDQDCDGDIDRHAVDVRTWYQDRDGDDYGDPQHTREACEAPEGFVSVSGDCDDSDLNVHPLAPETCGEVRDLNCDGSTGQQDGDADGFIACEECDDTNPNIYPGADELCDGVVNDCGRPDVADGADEPGFGQPCDAGDADLCEDGNTACDGTELFCEEVGPGASESCNGFDDDCDTLLDADDPDMVHTLCNLQNGVCTGATEPCVGGQELTCDEEVYGAHSPNYRSGAELDCDGYDNNCDGVADEDCCDGVGWRSVTTDPNPEAQPIAASAGDDVLVAWRDANGQNRYFVTDGAPWNRQSTTLGGGGSMAASGSGGVLALAWVLDRSIQVRIQHNGTVATSSLGDLHELSSLRQLDLANRGTEVVASVVVDTNDDLIGGQIVKAVAVVESESDQMTVVAQGVANVLEPTVAVPQSDSAASRWAVAWQVGSSSNNTALAFTTSARYDEDGAPRTIPLGGSAAEATLVATDSGYLMAYLSRDTGDAVLWTQPIRHDGTTGPATEVARGTDGTLHFPSLEVSPDHIVLVYSYASVVQVEILDATGHPTSSPVAIPPGASMSARAIATAHRDDLLFVFNARQVDTPSTFDLQVALVNADGELLCPSNL